MSVSWNNYKWVVFGDSLTDPLAEAGEQKYHYWISQHTGIVSTVYGKGSTGYWQYTNNNPNTRFYDRMKSATTDTDVTAVTIFGSVNDWKYWGGASRTDEDRYAIPSIGLDKNGNVYTFAEYHRVHGSYSYITSQQAYDILALTDTVTSTENTQYGITWVAYVNECINAAHEKFPNAQVVLVDEIFFNDTRFYNMSMSPRSVKTAIVQRRRELGDTWLSIVQLEKSNYSGIEDPDRLYLNTILGKGLSFDQLSDDTFRAYYTTDNKGHPTVLYNRIWLAPVFANILCEVLGENPENLPASLKMTQAEREDLYALWVGKPDTPTPPPAPTVIAYDINGSPMTEAYDINGELLTSLYDINGEVLVQ